MKLILILALLGALTTTTLKAEVGSDKFAHVGMSALLTTGTYLFLSGFTGREVQLRGPALIGASAFALGIGLAFEVADAQNGWIDGGDMAANIIGVALSATLIYTLDIHDIKPTPKGLVWQF